MAMMFAMIAVSIDAMLPALPLIAADLADGDTERAAMIISTFMLGMGAGTFIAGPLSDALGRKPILLGGIALYILGALLSSVAQSLEMLLLARAFQGVGAAGPRVAAMALIRDLHRGPNMAQIISFTMMVFTLVPAAAPLVGTLILTFAGWRAIFLAFVIFALITGTWLARRQSETLAPENRRPVRLKLMAEAITEMVSNRFVRLCIMAQIMCFGILVVTISLTQQVFDQVFEQAATFPYWFCAIALVSASGSFINARLVGRVGMLRLVRFALSAQILLSSAFLMLSLSGLAPDQLFPFYIVWQTSLFLQIALTLGNLNAVAMEPLGHMAGIATSAMGALSTVGGVLVAVPVILAFDATTVPMALGIAVMAVVGLWLAQMAIRNEPVFAT